MAPCTEAVGTATLTKFFFFFFFFFFPCSSVQLHGQAYDVTSYHVVAEMQWPVDLSYPAVAEMQWPVGLSHHAVAQASIKICKLYFKFVRVLSEC